MVTSYYYASHDSDSTMIVLVLHSCLYSSTSTSTNTNTSNYLRLLTTIYYTLHYTVVAITKVLDKNKRS